MPTPEPRDQGPWTPKAVVVWSVRRNSSIIHLPGEFADYGASEGATPACMEAHPLSTWTLRFLTKGMGASKCKRCFTKSGSPRRKYRPAGGWWRFK